MTEILEIIPNVIDALPLDPAVAQMAFVLLGYFGVKRGKQGVQNKRARKQEQLAAVDEIKMKKEQQDIEMQTEVLPVLDAVIEGLKSLQASVDSLDSWLAAQADTAPTGLDVDKFPATAQPAPVPAKPVRPVIPPRPVDDGPDVGTRNWRTNNPGALMDDGTNWQGLAEPRNDGRMLRFIDPMWGVRALTISVENAVERRSPTFAQFFKRYAPHRDGNDPGRYAAVVAQALGQSADEVPDFSTDENLQKFVEAVSYHEGADVHRWPKHVWSEGFALAGVS